MIDLTFLTASKIVCESSALKNQLGKLSKNLGGSKALIITDKGIMSCGFVDDAVKSLAAVGIETFVFDKVLADPPCSVVMDAIDIGKHKRVDIVIGLGGGSSIDTAKVVAAGVDCDQSLNDILDNVELIQSRVPLVAIPTTAGTGSEVTFVSVLTTDEGSKKALYSEKLLPDIALLDPDLTLDMPKHITAATALDAMVHTIEAFTSRTKKNAISDALSVKGLELLFQNFMKVIEDGSNIEARQNMLLGSTLAGMAFVNSSVAAIHGLSYPLSSRFHIPHGHSNSLVMAPVLRFNIEKAAKQYAKLASVVMPDRKFESDIEAANCFVDKMEELFDNSGLETRLGKLGVSERDIPLLAEDVVNMYTRLINTNPCDMSCEEIRAIYSSVL